MNNPIRFMEELMNPCLIIEARKDAIRFEKEGTIIDTCFCHDTQKWETAICRDLNQKKDELEHWTIVEEYSCKEKAYKGHKKWVKAISENPTIKLKECRGSLTWFFG